MALTLPLLGMGTWGMGGTFKEDSSNASESIEALRFGFELGLRLVDVAELHGDGLTEKLVGKAIKGYPREEIRIISKVSRDHLKYDDVLKAAEGSLKRLGTDYIDLYLIHKLPPGVTEPAAETLSALERLLKEGRVKHIGVSNFSVKQIEKASSYLSGAVIEANEIEYNLAYQEAAKEVIPYCKKRGIRVIAHRPLGKATLFREKIKMLDALAEKYDKTSAQVALNWIISQNVTAIPKAMKTEHMIENIGALGWKMEERDIELLKQTDGFIPYEKIN